MEITKAKVTKDNTLVATYTDETGTVTIEGNGKKIKPRSSGRHKTTQLAS